MLYLTSVCKAKRLSSGTSLRLRCQSNGGVGGAVLLVVVEALYEFEKEPTVEGVGISLQELATVVAVVKQIVLL